MKFTQELNIAFQEDAKMKLVSMEENVNSMRQDGDSLVLVQNGKAHAVIVIADQPALSAQEAASALQTVIQQMTGVLLPIQTESDFKGDATAVLVGMSQLAKRMGIDVKQARIAGDQYVIRTDEQQIALVGNDDGERRGSAYAVYDLLQRLGCGWFGPEPLWHVIPKQSKLTVPPLHIDECPAFDHRSIWMVHDRVMQDAWRLGGRRVSSGHALGRLVSRERYLDAHPEYFGESQSCLTHPDVIKIVADGFRTQLDERKGVLSFSLSAADTGGFCECAGCQAVGNISSRLLHFANAIASELAKTHPNRYLLTFLAYWYSHSPPNPMFKAAPNVCVMMVNEGNHVQPWDEPESPEVVQNTGRNNTREVTAFNGWQKTGAILAIYEWWIPGCSNENWRRVPWYTGETALRNLRYWKSAGVRFITYETQYEDGNGFPIRWPLYYIGARGLWNPNLTAEQIMTEACQKLYGPAAKPMLQFYAVIEKAMAESKEHGGNWNLPSPEKIYSPDVELQASRHLDSAAAVTADDTILARIAQERKMWDNAKEVMAKLRAAAKE